MEGRASISEGVSLTPPLSLPVPERLINDAFSLSFSRHSYVYYDGGVGNTLLAPAHDIAQPRPRQTAARCFFPRAVLAATDNPMVSRRAYAEIRASLSIKSRAAAGVRVTYRFLWDFFFLFFFF